MKTLDFHCDTIEKIYSARMQGKEISLLSNDLQLSVEGMQGADYILQCFALWIDCRKYHYPYTAYKDMLEVFREKISEAKIAHIKDKKGLRAVLEAKRLAGILTVEDGGIIGNKMELLDELFADGVRLMTLVWNYNNMIGTAAMEKTQDWGLTKFGREVVERMEELGMIVDVSHLSDKGVLDVLDVAKKPFIASHSNARAELDHPRNLSDTLIRQLANRGGVIGLNFCVGFLLPEFSWSKQIGLPPERAYIPNQIFEALVRHARHISDVGGIDCLSLGSDFDGIPVNTAIPNAAFMTELYDEFRRGGFPPSQIDKVFYGNGLRVLNELLP